MHSAAPQQGGFDLVHICDQLLLKEPWSELPSLSWSAAGVTTAINVIGIQNIDLWIVIECLSVMMYFFKGKKKLKMNIHDFPSIDILIMCV